jgi:hypothetical protein
VLRTPFGVRSSYEPVPAVARFARSPLTTFLHAFACKTQPGLLSLSSSVPASSFPATYARCAGRRSSSRESP